MARALAFVFPALGLVGCGAPGSGSDHCGTDALCGAGLVCTRDQVCLPADQVRAVHVSWTVSGAPASATSCAPAPDLQIALQGRGGLQLSFAPVPCAEGKFTVDRLADEYDRVALGRQLFRDAQEATIDAAGNAVLNLPY